MRRTFWVLALLLVAGCKTGSQTVEVAVSYPLANVHVVAKFEARDQQPRADESKLAKAEPLRTL